MGDRLRGWDRVLRRILLEFGPPLVLAIVFAWYAPAALAPVLALLAFATFAAVTAVGGRRAFEELLPD